MLFSMLPICKPGLIVDTPSCGATVVVALDALLENVLLLVTGDDVEGAVLTDWIESGVEFLAVCDVV